MEKIDSSINTISTTRLPFHNLERAQRVYKQRMKRTGKLFCFSALGVSATLACFSWPIITILTLAGAAALRFITRKRLKGKVLHTVKSLLELKSFAEVLTFTKENATFITALFLVILGAKPIIHASSQLYIQAFDSMWPRNGVSAQERRTQEAAVREYQELLEQLQTIDEATAYFKNKSHPVRGEVETASSSSDDGVLVLVEWDEGKTSYLRLDKDNSVSISHADNLGFVALQEEDLFTEAGSWYFASNGGGVTVDLRDGSKFSFTYPE
ncbi:MAG: hypothetical protein ACFB0D_07905 [Phormidesmis sp.]